MTSEKMTELGILQENRPGDRWYYTSEDNTANNVFTIDILNCFLTDFSGKEETASDIKFIVPPEDNRITEILFYKINTTNPMKGIVPEGYVGSSDTKFKTLLALFRHDKFLPQLS